MSSAQRKSVDSLESPYFFSPLSSPSSPPLSKDYAYARQDTSQRPNSSSKQQRSRTSTIGSVSSIGGALDISSSSLSEPVIETGQNAISSLLQPPIVRTGLLPHTTAPASSAHRQPNTRDIPPVALTNITQVDSSVFKPYLTQVGALYDALQRAKENNDGATLGLIRKSGRVHEIEDLLDPGKRPSISRHVSFASLALLAPPETAVHKRRLSGGVGRRAAHTPTPLSTIPSVYFEEDFHLENPRTFDVVSERSDVIRPAPGLPDKAVSSAATGPRKALATNAILQEKLSWYMDTIEVHLISSISTASSSFFAALGSLKELHSETADSVSRIKRLRIDLEALDKEMAIGGLEIVSKRRRRENLRQLSDAVHQLKCIVEVVGRCESLVDNGDVEIALDAVDSLEMLIRGERFDGDSKILGVDRQVQLRDLSDATALRGANSDLETLRFRIGRTFETRFLGALLGDLRSHINAVPFQEILQRWSSASQRSRGGHSREPSTFPTYLAMNDELRTELLAILSGLHRVRYMTSATMSYRESLLREIKNTIKRPLPSSNDDDNDSAASASTVGNRELSQQERSSILARNLRTLDPGAAEDILLKIYIGVGETLRRLGTQVKVLLDVTSTLEDPFVGERSPTRNPNMAAIDGRVGGSDVKLQSPSRQIQEEMHQALDISNLLGQAVDIAQSQIVKILRVRSEQSIHQTPVRFLRYFTINLLFANECEAVSGRGGTVLKNVVNGQIKDFIKQLGESEQQKLAAGMDNDQWNPQDFTEYDNEVLSRVLEGSDKDAEAWTVGGKVWLLYNEESPSVPPITNGEAPATNGNATKEKARPAVIDSESFNLPASAMLCLHGLQPFLQVITVIPSLSCDISASLLSYLQQFNSRCTQLILGAGATRSVGLKNITTKHLALASQALSFIATLIPYIREFVRRRAGSGAAVSSIMGEFDRVRRLYQEHQASISDKFVDIMASRAAVHVKSMKGINWDVPSSNAVSPYMEIFAKETTTLHKVLSKFLSPSAVHMIMVLVFQSYKDQWGKAFGDVTVATETGKERLLRDIDFINSRIGGVNGAGDFGEYILKIANDKTALAPVNTNVAKPENTVADGAQSSAQKGEKVEIPPSQLQRQAKVVTDTEREKSTSE